MANQHGERRWRNGLIFVAVLAAGLSAVGLALAVNPNEREVKPAPNVQDVDEIYDKDGNPKVDSKVWVLDFKFKDPVRQSDLLPGKAVLGALWARCQIDHGLNITPLDIIRAFDAHDVDYQLRTLLRNWEEFRKQPVPAN